MQQLDLDQWHVLVQFKYKYVMLHQEIEDKLSFSKLNFFFIGLTPDFQVNKSEVNSIRYREKKSSKGISVERLLDNI